MSRFEICCCVTNIAAALWGYFYPRPYDFCIAVLISLPWLSILAARLIHGSNALAYTVLGPVTALVACAYELEFSAAGRLVGFSCLVGTAFMAVVFLADWSAWRRYGLSLVIGSLFYGFGATGELNVLLDASGTKRFVVPILRRDYHIRRHSTFDLVLAPWGDMSRSNKHSVPLHIYLALRTESVACIDIGPGALGMPWSKISACEGSTARREP